MIGLDTNVLVRYLTRDDADQHRRAQVFLESTCTVENPGYINIIVLVELVWVLKAAYGATRAELSNVLEQILRTRQFEIARREVVFSALEDFKSGSADFSDCLLGRLNQEAGCTETVTFDRKATLLDGFRSL